MWLRTTAYSLLKRENRQYQGHTKYVHFNLDIVCFYAIFNKAVIRYLFHTPEQIIYADSKKQTIFFLENTVCFLFCLQFGY